MVSNFKKKERKAIHSQKEIKDGHKKTIFQILKDKPKWVVSKYNKSRLF